MHSIAMEWAQKFFECVSLRWNGLKIFFNAFRCDGMGSKVFLTRFVTMEWAQKFFERVSLRWNALKSILALLGRIHYELQIFEIRIGERRS